MIGIKVEKAHGEYDPGTSKIFGSPTMPEEWLTDGTIGDDDFFFCQLKASEYASFDKEKQLPESGYIYIFLRADGDSYIPNCLYCPTEPDTLIDDCNAGFDIGADIETEYSIDYEGILAADDGTALLVPCENGKTVLFQYDPLDDGMPDFLAATEKIARFSVDTSALKAADFSNVTFELI